MHARQLVLAFFTLLLMTAALITLDRGNLDANPASQAALENVRAHLPAQVPGGPEYAVDGGRLLVGRPGQWREIPAPEGVIVAAVDVIPLADAHGDLRGEILYIGAANQLAVYTSRDRGQSWTLGALTHPRVHAHVVGGVTALALDPVQQLLYVGTDTAGLFRVRILPTGLVSTAQLLLAEPVQQVVVDRRGRGLALVRTAHALYRSEEHGLRWVEVNSLPAVPTALVMLQAATPSYIVGTADGGLLRSEDGITWRPLAHNLGATLRVDALAADPLRGGTVYAALSEEEATHTARLVYSEDSGESWSHLTGTAGAKVTDLLPVSGRRAAVYALTAASRTPHALGNAPVVTATAAAPATSRAPLSATRILGWIAAGLGALALAFALLIDVMERRRAFPTTLGDAAPVRVPNSRRRWS